MTELIVLTGVTKVFKIGLFKSKNAVSDLSLTVPQGKVIGLLGPNGSGKSTTIKMIMGFLRPTAGEIRVCGFNTNEKVARKHIGYLPENPRFQKFLKGRDILSYYGHLHGLKGSELGKRCEKLFEIVGLKHAMNERVQGYSKGMTQRLALAQALVNNPSLLIFDEPMSGLDPLGRMEIRRLISDIHEQMPESTIFFSSHILDDVEQLCSMVALLRKGTLKTYCPIEELIMKEEQRFDVTVKGLSETEEKRLASQVPIRKTAIGRTLTFNGTQALIKELELFKEKGVDILGVQSHKRNLEEALFRDGEFATTSGSEVNKEVSL